MNKSLAIFLITDEARAIAVGYEPNDAIQAAKLFKTLDPAIQKDDYVVVETNTRHGMTVVKVLDVDVEPDMDSTVPMCWIIGKVEKADFDKIKEQEDAAIDAINKAEKRRRREQLAADLKNDMGEENFAKLTFNGGEADEE